MSADFEGSDVGTLQTSVFVPDPKNLFLIKLFLLIFGILFRIHKMWARGYGLCFQTLKNFPDLKTFSVSLGIDFLLLDPCFGSLGTLLTRRHSPLDPDWFRAGGEIQIQHQQGTPSMVCKRAQQHPHLDDFRRHTVQRFHLCVRDRSCPRNPGRKHQNTVPMSSFLHSWLSTQPTGSYTLHWVRSTI